ncbi:MAG: FtsW/RodA/SpoVE family cell cycle protein [Selenomonadaceae bacterium]|nr:FtsW/RodA/SpoVE family cell cycle protein [Selenomonadaceae bacterium]
MGQKNYALLLAPLGILLCGLTMLSAKDYATGQLDFAYWPYLLTLIVAVGLIQAILRRIGADTWLFYCVLLLLSVGLVMIARLAPDLFIPQLRWAIIGLLMFLLVLRFDQVILKLTSYQYILGLACLTVLGLPLFFGTEIGGSLNWLVFGSFQVQPSEFGKILLVFFLAGFLSDHASVLKLPRYKLLFWRLPPPRFLAPLLSIWGMALVMFVVQRDLGSALLFFGIAVLMTYIATGMMSYVAMAFGFFAMSGILSYNLFNHVRVRLAIWLDPWADPTGMAYQVVQSLFAFGSGGVWGVGFGQGSPRFIPEVHTDFIFSAIAEELGLIGSWLLLLVYALFFFRAVKIALACRGEDKILLGLGVGIAFFLQTFIIVAGVTKFLPLTGITLPFVSYGGSSMVSGFILLGILAALSRRKNGGETA